MEHRDSAIRLINGMQVDNASDLSKEIGALLCDSSLTEKEIDQRLLGMKARYMSQRKQLANAPGDEPPPPPVVLLYGRGSPDTDNDLTTQFVNESMSVQHCFKQETMNKCK